jgi:hypothetical protein
MIMGCLFVLQSLASGQAIGSWDGRASICHRRGGVTHFFQLGLVFFAATTSLLDAAEDD